MKALIVDDEEHVRDAIEHLVDWTAFKIHERYTAESVDEAEQIIKEHQPEILLCDMKLPEKNGIHLIESIKQKNLNIQVIVISGYDDFEYMRAVIQAKAVDYLLKPIRKGEIEKALRQAVENWKEAEITGDWQDLMLIENDDATDPKDVIQDIKHFLDRHYAEKITLEKLSQTFYLTPQYISHRFKETFGVSVIEYVTSLKLTKAKSLLLQTHQSISEIALSLGFSDENYFSKVFKKHEELSPKQYREQNR